MSDADAAPGTVISGGVVPERLNGLLVNSEIRSVAGLARRVDVDRASISQKLHGRRRWYLDEVVAIATALNTTVAYLIGETDSPSSTRSVFTTDDDPDALGLFMHADGRELSRRLRYLQDTSVITMNERMPEGHPLSGDPERWSTLLTLTTRVRVSRKLLEALASFFHVPTGYLLDLDQPDHAERVEAEIEFDRAVQESGVKRVAARSLGSLSAAEIRAITAALRK